MCLVLASSAGGSGSMDTTSPPAAAEPTQQMPTEAAVPITVATDDVTQSPDVIVEEEVDIGAESTAAAGDISNEWTPVEDTSKSPSQWSQEGNENPFQVTQSPVESTVEMAADIAGDDSSDDCVTARNPVPQQVSTSVPKQQTSADTMEAAGDAFADESKERKQVKKLRRKKSKGRRN